MEAADFFWREQGSMTRLLNKMKIPHVERETFRRLFYQEQAAYKSLHENYKLTNTRKKSMVTNYIINNNVIILAIIAAQDQGKDALACDFFDEIKWLLGERARIVTLGNPVAPPFVGWACNEPIADNKKCPFFTMDEEEECPAHPEKILVRDQYFNLLEVPEGTDHYIVYIYVSELDLFFAARDFSSQANKTLNAQLNTLRQRRQKILGCAKLAANVDVSFWRACNIKLFKYIPEEALKHERSGDFGGFIPPVGMLIRPKDPTKKDAVLAVFNDQYRTFTHQLPPWYNDGYSRQFSNIKEEQAIAFGRGLYVDDMEYKKISHQIAFVYKFNRSTDWWKDKLEPKGDKKIYAL